MKCFECGDLAKEKHHVVPKSLGGTKTIDLCIKCHAKAHQTSRSANHSELTKIGIEKARALGVTLGRPQGFHVSEAVRKKQSDTCKSRPIPYSVEVVGIVKKCRAEDKSLAYIADTLNERGLKTNKGSKFTPTHIFRILKMVKDRENQNV